MSLPRALSFFYRLPSPRTTFFGRIRIAWSILTARQPKAAVFNSTSLGYGGFTSVVATDGFKHIYIGVPGAFRVWLNGDGTYKIDIPNEQAKEQG